MTELDAYFFKKNQYMILVIKHESNEGPGTLGDFIKSSGYKVEIAELAKGDSLPSLSECDWIISLGGPMNVYEEDEYPFLGLEDEFLRGAIEKKVPTLGICLGAQMLAKCMKAEVIRSKVKEIGWCQVRLTKDARYDPLFHGLPESLTVFQWHEDTFAVPVKSVLLATGSECQNQAIRIGHHAWAIQFHPEMTPQMIPNWAKTSTLKSSRSWR